MTDDMPDQTRRDNAQQEVAEFLWRAQVRTTQEEGPKVPDVMIRSVNSTWIKNNWQR